MTVRILAVFGLALSLAIGVALMDSEGDLAHFWFSFIKNFVFFLIFLNVLSALIEVATVSTKEVSSKVDSTEKSHRVGAAAESNETPLGQETHDEATAGLLTRSGRKALPNRLLKIRG